jgi:hypothetical protein
MSHKRGRAPFGKALYSHCVGPESGVFMFLSVNSISTCTENTRGSKTSDIESNITDLSFEVLNKHHSLIHVTG